MLMYWILFGIAVIAVIAACLIVPVIRKRREENNLIQARELFHRRREWLEARFVTMASQSGKPRGLAWVDCEFDNGACFARDRSTGQLHCFVGVTVSFEAIEGGGMEDVEAVGNLRAATAVFGYDGKEWSSEGRTIFNLNPDEAIEHFHAHPV